MKETINMPEPSLPDDRSQRIPDRFKFRRVNEITGTRASLEKAFLDIIGYQLQTAP